MECMQEVLFEEGAILQIDKKNKKQMKVLSMGSLLVHFGMSVLHRFIACLVCNKRYVLFCVL